MTSFSNAGQTTNNPALVDDPPLGLVELNNNGPQTFIIPMSQVLGLFDPYMSLLIPAGLLAGANFLLRLKNLQESLIYGGPGTVNADGATAFAIPYTTNFSVTGIYFMLDAFQLNDAVLKRLNQVAAGEDGMAFMFDTFDNSLVSNAQVGATEIQVQQARSRISRSFCIVRDLDTVTNPYVPSLCSESLFANTGYGAYPTTDATLNRYVALGPNVAGNAPNVISYQAQLGSLFFPQQPLGTQYREEFWMNQLYVWLKGMTDELATNTIGFLEFFGARGISWNAGRIIPGQNAGAFSFPFGLAQFGMLAERSQLLQLSGLPISNARLLRHKFTFGQATASGLPRQIDCFTQFTRVVKVFLGGRVVVRE
jgi:hypothetical protein